MSTDIVYGVFGIDYSNFDKRMTLTQALTIMAMVSACNGSQSIDCKPCHCKTSKTGGIIAVCTGLGLTAVPDSIPSDTKVLLLNKNKFKHLDKGMLKRFSHLERLDLSRCNLSSLDVSSFRGLTHLKVLMLADNELRLNNLTYPQGLFRDLQSLKVLDVRKNDDSSLGGSTYNLQAFYDLISLEKLFIDGLFRSPFGAGFEKLRKLRYLNLSGARGYCSVKHLTNSSFKQLTRLRHVDVSYCKIFEIENYTFASLKQIDTLDLSFNQQLGFETLGKALYGIIHSPLRVLDISYIVNYFKVVHLKVEHLLHLKQTKMKVLRMNGNGIDGVDVYVPTLFPHLTHLYIKANRILSGLYWFALDPMQSLQYVDGSQCHPSRTLPFLPQSQRKRSVTSKKKMKSWLKYVSNPFPGNPKLMLPMPQNVRTINGSYCHLSGKIDKFPLSPNNVTLIDLSFNLLTEMTASEPPLDKLEFADLSYNYLSNLTKDFFKLATGLQVLNLSHNYLYETFRKDKEGLTFVHNSRLKILRIAVNFIQNLPEQLFQSLSELEILDLSKNELSNWEPKINQMTNLSLLDISGNRLEDIPSSLRNDIDEIHSRRPWPLDLMISGNSFMCDCSNLQYLHWLKTADINVSDLSIVKCKLWNGDIVNMDPLEDLLMDLHQHCHVVSPLIFGTVGGITVFLTILISGIIYRYRWKLRYLYYTTKRKHRGYQRLAVEDEDAFVYDAFISHADEDRGFVIEEMRKILEDTFGLKLCIHHRDFIVGQSICENIINAIQTSRKTIVILSPDFVKSAWCDYEVHMAKIEGIHTGRDVICVIMYEDVPDRRKMSTDLLHEIAHGTYIEYPDEVDGKDHFWNSLKDAITSRE